MCQSNSISIDAAIQAMFLIAPQFATTDPTKLTAYTQLAELVRCQINASVLACCGVMVFAFLLAHYLTLQANANLGVASNMSEGELSIGFNVSPDMSILNTTPYGRSYLDLIQRTVNFPVVTNLPPVLGGVAQYVPGCYGYGYGYGGCC